MCKEAIEALGVMSSQMNSQDSLYYVIYKMNYIIYNELLFILYAMCYVHITYVGSITSTQCGPHSSEEKEEKAKSTLQV